MVRNGYSMNYMNSAWLAGKTRICKDSFLIHLVCGYVSVTFQTLMTEACVHSKLVIVVRFRY
jgi:hypothetical protein|uniref:Uncharacterized protein n=1 Tax=Arabidopsis thaliana TaxID=3702 RepID=Q8GYY4_ARATH|nr:unknown protein [Arabidopsis thaliana]